MQKYSYYSQSYIFLN